MVEGQYTLGLKQLHYQFYHVWCILVYFHAIKNNINTPCCSNVIYCYGLQVSQVTGDNEMFIYPI